MAYAIYGEVLYQPFDIIDKWLYNRGGRAAGFFCAAVWAMGELNWTSTSCIGT